MSSRTGQNRIRAISTPESVGWEIEDGPYVLVNKLDTEVISVDSFLDSSATKDLRELQNYSYPSGHWFLFPYNSITVQGSRQFNVSLTLSAAKLETQYPAEQQPASNKSTTTSTTTTAAKSTSITTTTSTTTQQPITTSSTTKLETTSTTLTTHTTEEISTDTQPTLFLVALVVVVTAFALIILRNKKKAKRPET